MPHPLVDFWENHVSTIGPFAWSALAIALYHAVPKRDARTAIEWTVITWMLVAVDVVLGVRSTFVVLGGVREPWEMAVVQYDLLVARTLLPALLSLPVLWRIGTLPDRGRVWPGWFLVAANVVLVDVLTILALLRLGR